MAQSQADKLQPKVALNLSEKRIHYTMPVCCIYCGKDGLFLDQLGGLDNCCVIIEGTCQSCCEISTYKMHLVGADLDLDLLKVEQLIQS